MVNRLADGTGRCGAGSTLRIYRWGPHMGEEPPISGYRGSGTVFFSSCPLRCVYCQNSPWSQSRPLAGDSYSVPDLAAIFLRLQSAGCHNINLVTPEPWIPHILQAVPLARAKGLVLPIAYNTSGFVTEESLRLLDGTVDIYLTDLRYATREQARTLSGAADYFDAARVAASIMWKQVGPLVCGPDGTARRGLIVRHLLIPGLDASAGVLDFIAHELSPDCHVSLMGQFEPLHQAAQIPSLARRVSPSQYGKALAIMRRMGVENGWRQPPGDVEAELVGESMEPTSRRQLWRKSPEPGGCAGDGTVLT